MPLCLSDRYYRSLANQPLPSPRVPLSLGFYYVDNLRHYSMVSFLLSTLTLDLLTTLLVRNR